MFGSIKKAMVAGAVVATAALAGPAMASADTWQFDGNPIASEDVVAHGSLTLVPQGQALRVTCDVTLDVTLSNPNADVQVNNATFSGCVTNVPGCTVTATAAGTGSTLPWLGNGDALNQKINVGGVYFTNNFGAGCPPPLTSGSFFETGTLEPDFDSGAQQINFDGTSNTGTLTGPLGTAWVSGTLDVTTPNGEVLDLV